MFEPTGMSYNYALMLGCALASYTVIMVDGVHLIYLAMMTCVSIELIGKSLGFNYTDPSATDAYELDKWTFPPNAPGSVQESLRTRGGRRKLH